MRYFISLMAVIVCVSASGAFANEAVDEFTQFQNDLRRQEIGPSGGRTSPMAPRMGGAPQTPEELQRMMEEEAQEQQRKVNEQRLDYIRRAMMTVKSSAEELKKQELPFKDSIVADSTIEAVTVFSNRAQVTRSAVVEVPPGVQAVLFKGVPKTAQLYSLRVSGSADADVEFGSVVSREVKDAVTFTEREKELIPQIEAKETQMLELQAEKAALEAQGKYLSAVTPDTAGDKAGKGDMMQASTIARNLREGMADVYKSFVELNTRERALKTELESLRNEFLAVQTMPGSSYYVKVPVTTEKGAKIRINLTYEVNEATWEPIYDIRLDSKANSVAVTQYGLVRQTTGEDWKGVALTLSTAKPLYYDYVRTVKTRWVDIQPATSVVAPRADGDPLVEWRQKTEAKRLAMEQESVPEEGDVEAPKVVPMVQPIHPQPTVKWDNRKASFRPASVESGGFVSEYKIPAASTVMSDGGDVRVMMGVSSIEGELAVLVRPQEDQRGFIVYLSKLKGNTPLYPGQASLFRDSSYCGQFRMPLVRPGQEQQIFFGVDDRVAVRHNTVKNEKQQSGLISPDNVIEREYVTEIENLHETPIKLVVEQGVPASKNEKLALSLNKEQTTPGYATDLDNTKGLLRWNIDVPAQTRQDVKLSWKLAWPKDYVLRGMQSF